MPTYPLKNLKTGETKELRMSIADYDQWKKDIKCLRHIQVGKMSWQEHVKQTEDLIVMDTNGNIIWQ